MMRLEEIIPPMGLGTWMNTLPEQCMESVVRALNMGYRHIDTAHSYENLEYVGEGLRKSSASRDKISISSKIHPKNLEAQDVERCTDKILELLGVEYLDILYIHWPALSYDPEETISAFNSLYEQGKTRRIGVSNFTIDLLEEAQTISEASVTVNQVEIHPLWQQEVLRDYADQHDIQLIAYSPLARGKVFTVPELTEIANKYDVSEAQVSLAWLMEHDIIPIPMADTERHLQENYRAQNLELNENDHKSIESISNQRKFVDPDYAPW